ncbi:MAG: penicillin-binding transpeptidase domain-containing protein [Candidatus Howiella sp.]
MHKTKKHNIRYIAIALLLIAILLAYNFRLIQLQVLDADYYLSQASTASTRSVSIQASRGEILDRYGRALAVNRDGYNIVFNRAYMSGEEINQNIRSLLSLLEKSGEEWFDKLPLESTAPYNFTEDEAAVETMKSRIGLAHYATSENCYAQMVRRYKLEGLDTTLQRRLMGVRYSMELADFSIANPYTFAEDISTDTMTRILESAFDLPGIEIDVVPIREYPDTSIAPSIMGTIGPIYAEDWESLKSQGYSYNDKVGKSGIEGYAESYLKGADGVREITTDGDGNILSSQVTKEAVSGNTVILGLDKKLQKVAQTELENLVNNLKTSTDGEASAGACVAIQVKTGEVLASANYPSYTLDEYYDDYAKLAADTSKPLFDRAFNGIYPPGSSFKPAVALAALNEGIIAKDTTIRCVHTYSYYTGYRPSCLGTHGYINVVNALSKSCNYFFFDVGRQLGIDKLNAYCKQLGLGVLTGVEISESKGILASPAYRESVGGTWHPGDVIQAAIGQSDNSFTPLQLATYTATIANGGTRYQSRLIHEIRSYSLDQVVIDSTPTVLNTLQLAAGTLDTVKEGMLSVTEDGTGSGTFRSYSIKVGGKTGTAETSLGGDNSMFIAFAPYEDPEIAVAVIVEHGGHGSGNGSLVKAIFDAYFFASDEKYDEPAYNALLQ